MEEANAMKNLECLKPASQDVHIHQFFTGFEILLANAGITVNNLKLTYLYWALPKFYQEQVANFGFSTKKVEFPLIR